MYTSESSYYSLCDHLRGIDVNDNCRNKETVCFQNLPQILISISKSDQHIPQKSIESALARNFKIHNIRETAGPCVASPALLINEGLQLAFYSILLSNVFSHSRSLCDLLRKKCIHPSIVTCN